MRSAEETRQEIGRQVAEARRASHLSVRQAAQIADIDFANWSKLENGKYNASIDILARACAAVGAEIKIQREEE